MRMPTIIFIDWFKTLSFSQFWETQPADGNQVLSATDIDSICTWLFKDNPTIVSEWMKGRFSAEEVCSHISAAVQLPYDRVFKSLQDSCEAMTLCHPSVGTLLASIRSKGVKLVVATDNMDTFRRFTIPALSLEGMFDDFLISSETGYLKYESTPSSIPFFDRYLSTHNARYEDVVLFDDAIERKGHYQSLGFRIEPIGAMSDLLMLLREHAGQN